MSKKSRRHDYFRLYFGRKKVPEAAAKARREHTPSLLVMDNCAGIAHGNEFFGSLAAGTK